MKDISQKEQEVKNDAFYTRYEDVERELSMYDKSIWKDKVVLCNCDDAAGDDKKKSSAFTLYFLRNFKELGLKKLICIHYGSKIDLFNQGVKKGYVYSYTLTKEGFRGEKEYPIGYNGSFDHPLSLKILNEEADIVCTNPPLSRVEDYWKIIIESGKKFIIISDSTNLKNDAYMPYFLENKAWAGYNRVDYCLNAKKKIVETADHWYTNIPINNRPKYKFLKIMPLEEIPTKHTKYDDSKMLLVYNCFVPSNYNKPFAVSINSIVNGLLEKGYKYVQDKEYVPYIKGKRKFTRVLVQKI